MGKCVEGSIQTLLCGNVKLYGRVTKKAVRPINFHLRTRAEMGRQKKKKKKKKKKKTGLQHKCEKTIKGKTAGKIQFDIRLFYP